MVLTRLHKHLIFGRKYCQRINVDATNIIQKWKDKLTNENIPEVESSIYHIVGHLLKRKTLNRKNLLELGQKLTKQQQEYFEELCELRMGRMPVQYIIQEWDFRDFTLKMHPPVFIPRPETEQLIEILLQHIDTEKEQRFMEIGCGSGAISIALLKSLPQAKCLTIDQSKLACELTHHNVKQHKCENRIKIIRHKLSKQSNPNSFGAPFDLIVSNPPYIPKQDLINLDPEIKLYEDLRALDGGSDGMDIIKLILTLAGKKLQTGGQLWLEIDPRQTDLIQQYLIDSSNHLEQLKYENSFNDLSDRKRFVKIVKL